MKSSGGAGDLPQLLEAHRLHESIGDVMPKLAEPRTRQIDIGINFPSGAR
jgi:hypothetical protein